MSSVCCFVCGFVGLLGQLLITVTQQREKKIILCQNPKVKHALLYCRVYKGVIYYLLKEGHKIKVNAMVGKTAFSSHKSTKH